MSFVSVQQYLPFRNPFWVTLVLPPGKQILLKYSFDSGTQCSNKIELFKARWQEETVAVVLGWSIIS